MTPPEPGTQPLDSAGAPDREPAAAATASAAPAEPIESTESPALGSASVADVEQELAAALARAEENHELFLRARAETENVRRRAQDDVAKAHKYAIESFAEALVPVMDSLERALAVEQASAEALREGVQLTLRQLQGAFERARLVPIDPAGAKFDPHRHQAISMVPAPDGVAPSSVVTVLQKGWMIADRVLRPALVTVASG